MYTIISSVLAENHCPYSMDATNIHFIWALPLLTILAVLTIIIRYILVKKHCPSSKDTATNLQSTASHSPSSSPSSSSWDVFLSFRGKDTRRNFVSHLYSELDQAGIQTFRDDPALRKGEVISPALHGAITSSDKFIVVISENYAHSAWCLDELEAILSCNRTGNQVIPVFYYVHPSDVRYQKGSFGQALDFHKKRYSVNKIKKWRSALAEIADLSGYHLKIDADENEADTIREIVRAVAPQVYPDPEQYLLGVDFAVKDVYEKSNIESNDFCVIGIYGMHGIGKTTLAKAFYNTYINNFDIGCFIENVKEIWKGSNPLLSLLEQSLSELLKRKDYKVPDVGSGMRQLKHILGSKNALIVLDDLDRSSHSDLLVRICNLCSDGSRVIVTTTDVHLLNQLRDISKVYIHQVKKLNQEVSLNLFNHYAFMERTPPENLRELAVKIVNYVGGLPLALKVLGSSLRGRTDVSFWKDQLEKVRVNPEINKILQRSYDELGDRKEKAIFLDIVFFFIGKDVNEGVHVFKSCGFCPEAGIRILVERCLLTIDQNKRFQMHSLIQDMGREVILAEAEHGKPKRLRLEGNACLTLQDREGTDTIEGLILNLTLTNGYISTKIFQRLPNLRLLEIIGGNDIKGNIENSFHELRCIRWPHCPWTRLPLNFRPQKLVSLDMPFNKFKKLPTGILNLKTINVSYSKNLNATSDFRDLKLVEKLVLRGCKCLLEVHPSIGQLAYLIHLDLGKCNNLKDLPESIGQLTQLSRLELDECEHLKELPEAIGQLTKLKNLEFFGCRSLKRLPEPIKQLANLVSLDMCSCHNLKRLPEQLGDMKGLKMIDVSDTPIKELPDSIVHLKKLVELKLIWCTKLRKLPEQFGDMEGLGKFNARHSAVEQLPDSFGRLINLVDLELSHCKNLVSLPNNIWKLELLRQLSLSSCSKLKQLPEKLGNMKCLERLDARHTSIEELPDSIGQLSRLQGLDLYCCNIKYMPNSIGNLPSLANLDVGWEDSTFIFPDIVKLRKLKRLQAKCNIRLWLPVILELSDLTSLTLNDEGQSFSSTEPVSFSKLSNLQRLSLGNWTSIGSSFPEVPPNIQELAICNHKTLEHLPDLSNLKQLQEFTIWYCISLQSLPSFPIHLNLLEVSECPSLHDPPDLSMLKELRTLRFDRCSGLNSIGLQQSFLLHVGDEFSSGFTATIPNRKIAEWFSYKSSGNTIYFDIPPDLGDNFLGVALWLVYTCKTTGKSLYSYIRAVITNKTEGVKMNHDFRVLTHDTVGEVSSRVECIRRDEISTNVQLRMQRNRGDRISMKSGDRIKIQFQSLLYFYDGGYEYQCGELKVEACGAHVIQRTPQSLEDLE